MGRERDAARITRANAGDPVITIDQVALGLYWAWLWVVYETDAPLVSIGFETDDLSWIRTLSLATMGVTLVLGAPFGRALERRGCHTLLAGVAVFLGPLSLVALSVPSSPAAHVAGALFIGFSQAALAFLWALYITGFPNRRAYQAYCVSVSVVVGGVVFLGISTLSGLALATACGIVPAAAGFAFLARQVGETDLTSDAESPEEPSRKPSLFTNLFYDARNGNEPLKEYDSLLVRINATLGIYGLIYGGLRWFSHNTGSANPLVVMLLFVVTGLCLSAYIRGARTKSLGTIWKLILPTTLVGIVLIPTYATFASGLSIAIVQIGYLLFESLIWIAIFDAMAQLGLNRAAVFGVGRGVTALAMSLGLALSPRIMDAVAVLAPALQGYTVLAMTIITAVVLVLVNVFLLNEKEVAAAGLLEEIADDEKPVRAVAKNEERSIEDVCAELSQTYRLTSREAEVLGLLMRGRSGPQISEELFLSKSTVKTHTYNIYKKMDVHTRAELMARQR